MSCKGKGKCKCKKSKKRNMRKRRKSRTMRGGAWGSTPIGGKGAGHPMIGGHGPFWSLRKMLFPKKKKK